MQNWLYALARIFGLWVVFVGSVWAVPSLQLGPGSSGTWEYVGGGDDTWYVSDSAFSLAAYANSLDGNGDYGFDTGNTDRTAYLVFSAVPSSTSTTPFELSVTGDSGALTLVQQGYGSPPDADATKSKDDLPPHSIYDTYFYIYEFNFDGPVGTIGDTQPGQTGTGNGYSEEFSVLVSNLEAGISGVHADLFTVTGDGKLKTSGVGELSNVIFANAPFSHDAQYTVPEPGIVALLGLGALGLGWQRRRAKRS